MAGLIWQCREDTTRLQSLLQPFLTNGSSRVPSKISLRVFVVRREAEIERTVASFRSTFNTLASYLNVLSLKQTIAHSSTQSGGSVVSLYQFRNGSVAQSLLAMLSFFDNAKVSMQYLRNMFDQESLYLAVADLLSKSLLRQDLPGDAIQIDSSAQEIIRSELMMSNDGSRHLVFAIQSLTKGFREHLTRPRTLRRVSSLHMHVSTVLNTAMESPPELVNFAGAATLAVHYCMYLITMGYFKKALKFVLMFQNWGERVLHAHFDAKTSLRAKEAVARVLQGDNDTALHIFHRINRSRTRNLGKDDIRTLHSINGLGLAYHAVGDNERAAQYHQKALVAKNATLGSNDPDTLVTANNLGIVLQSQGDNKAAHKLFSRSLKGWLQTYDVDDLLVLTAKSNLGIALHFQGLLEEAAYNHRYVFRKRYRILGATHPETIKSKANLAITINEQGQHAQAEVLYREALTSFQDELGDSHPDTLKTHTNLATALHDQGKFDEAHSVLASAIPLIRTKYGRTHAETLEAIEFRSILLQHLGKFSKALDIATEVYEVRNKQYGYDHEDTQRSLRHVRDLAEDCEEAHVMQRFSSGMAVVAC
ncbi:kinesin light chain [Pyrenophora tritici-repentis]|nr:kinesin light chain [Pyrenophora tritici-repentis]KAI0573270.1 kinesin light chain [Pyrenophora tritici-repentis]KAI0577079.1 kinesin light chain [Pyrenophora tritici-repentis]KAI0607131.1 kinesin light chain [Pyrenophora tritici-repentis]KAI0619305.1 kinesin light chain [Pyrenophora tritici-repentis]